MTSQSSTPDLQPILVGERVTIRPICAADWADLDEIKQSMLQHAFHFADTVVFWGAETNLRSRAAMEKIGGMLRPGTQIRGGSDVPHVIYEIRKA